MKKFTSPPLLTHLYVPPRDSHKGDNGRLLIIAGSKQYHGSLLLAVKAASRIVDLIYILTTPENQKLITKLKNQTAVFIPIKKFADVKNKIDCVLIGPGMGVTAHTKKLTASVLKSGIKAVLDADALKALNKPLLTPRHVLTPHAREFEIAFGLKPTAQNVQKMVNTYGCTVVLKGKVDIIGSPNGPLTYNQTGNAGMTKGGTGDVLAGLIAALYCKNDTYLAATVGAYLNGLAGDELYKTVGPYYDAEDLVNALPICLNPK